MFNLDYSEISAGQDDNTIQWFFFRKMSRTFRLETRSAVSSKVNWLIWSTMSATLGFVVCVVSHRREGGILCRSEKEGAAQRGRGGVRSARAQNRNAMTGYGTDIMREIDMWDPKIIYECI